MGILCMYAAEGIHRWHWGLHQHTAGKSNSLWKICECFWVAVSLMGKWVFNLVSPVTQLLTETISATKILKTISELVLQHVCIVGRFSVWISKVGQVQEWSSNRCWLCLLAIYQIDCCIILLPIVANDKPRKRIFCPLADFVSGDLNRTMFEISWFNLSFCLQQQHSSWPSLVWWLAYLEWIFQCFCLTSLRPSSGSLLFLGWVASWFSSHSYGSSSKSAWCRCSYTNLNLL